MTDCERRPVDHCHHAGGHVLPHQHVERAQTLLRRDPARSHCLQLFFDPLPLLLGLAKPGPRPPRDRLAGEPQRPPVSHELIQKCVGHPMIGLTRIAHDARDAREHDEQVQIAVRSCPVQLPCPQHFRPQHLFELLPRLVRQRPVRQHAHAVDDTRKWRQCFVDACQHGVHRRRVRHVGQFHLHLHAALAQRVDGCDGLGVRVAAPVQHDSAGAPVRQPGSQSAPDPAKTAGHQVGPVFSQPSPRQGRHGQDVLPDVPRGAHEVHRRPGFSQ